LVASLQAILPGLLNSSQPQVDKVPSVVCFGPIDCRAQVILRNPQRTDSRQQFGSWRARVDLIARGRVRPTGSKALLTKRKA
jgi:hypothetical protein